jgi:hypothetical protein
MSAQRYPEGFDRHIVGAPANNQIYLCAWRMRLLKTRLKSPQHALSPNPRFFKKAAGVKAVLQTICWVIARWNKQQIQQELTARGLTPIPDDPEWFESFHVRDYQASAA